MKKITFTIACIILITAISGLCQARVTGECSNCHTMHNSQGGTDIGVQIGYAPTSVAKASLLRANGCLGCHATTGDGWTGVGGAPIVYNTGGPTYGDFQPDGKRVGLAAGNFYWTTEGSGERGHSGISGIPYADDISIPSNQRTECGTKECHTALSDKGCESCHLPAHHKHGTTTTIVDEEDGYYRFLGPIRESQGGSDQHLWGVRGYEDPDWQKTSASSDHNEYSGEAETTGYHSISRHCGCHYNYPTTWGTCRNFSVGSRAYHKATQVLPDPGAVGAKYKGYVGYNEHPSGPWDYDPKLPIARTNITGSWLVNKVYHSTTDALMCLTCHRAHASPYNKMLRWDNTLDLAKPGAYYGCMGCHNPDPL